MLTSVTPPISAALLAKLADTNAAFAQRYPGMSLKRQPVHTLYGGAHLYKPGAAAKIARLAQAHFLEYAPDHERLAQVLAFPGYENLKASAASERGSPAWLTKTLFERVKLKLATEAIEDHRADFEDGYGVRGDVEEDEHARLAAVAMAEGLLSHTLPPYVGIRIKALSEGAKSRALRTLDIFLTTLVEAASGEIPTGFRVTLPKVISPEQVEVASAYLDVLEAVLGIENHAISLELMLENVQSLFDEQGNLGLRRLVSAAAGRVKCLILGTFDYTATCNIAATFQAHDHPAADFARQMMLADLMGTEVMLVDGITNIMPIPRHRGANLSTAQVAANQTRIYDAWRLHFNNIIHSMKLGFYQGWDLNPAQIPVRFAAVYYFYLTGLLVSQERLKTFIDQAAQASMVGNTFDDAATGQGLVNFFVNGINCGALTEMDALATGITLNELYGRSFMKIVENRAVNP